MLSSSPWDAVIGFLGMVQTCARGGSDWTFGTVSFPRVVKRWNRRP